MPGAAAAQVPRHIAIVMDGNGRWAKQRRRPRSFGHSAGRKAVRSVVEGCLRQGVAALTLFAFSSENWQRPEQEVGALMTLFLRALDKEAEELHAQGVRLRFIGQLDRFGDELRERMQQAMTRTAANDRLAMNVAVNYGGRQEIVHAAQVLAERAVAGTLEPAALDEATFDAATSLAALPPLDLFIRTGGERRVSNFLLWQLAYAELYFTDTLWPDFDQVCLAQAIADFAGRERRFGLTGAQVARASGG